MFKVLGPIEVHENGRELVFRGKLERALLVALLLRAEQVQTADQLIDDLWGECPPHTARASLHNRVANLRRILGGRRLETTPAGYMIHVAGNELDAAEFERLVARGGALSAADKVAELEGALGLWRGDALLELRYESFAQAEIRRLEELRVFAQEELVGAKLELGESATLVPELERLVSNFPYRERLRMQFMVALSRCGRSVDALAQYSDWQRVLREPWAIEPSRRIRQLAEAIRAGRDDVGASTERVAGTTA